MNNQLIDSVILAAITGAVSLFLIILILVLYFKKDRASDNGEKKESLRKTLVYPLRDRPLERETDIDSGYGSNEYNKDDSNARRTKQKNKSIVSRSQPLDVKQEEKKPQVHNSITKERESDAKSNPSGDDNAADYTPTTRNRERSNPDVKKCPFCGGEMGRFSKICRNCGALVKGRN